MKIQDIKDYPWPDEVHAAGLVGPGVPYLALRDETGKWFHSADFDDPATQGRDIAREARGRLFARWRDGGELKQ